MQLRSSEEVRDNVEKFSKRYLNLLKDKKNIDEDIKALKDEFKEDGVPVSVVCSAINKVKARKKKSDGEIFEEETIQEWLESNVDIDNAIGDLAEK
jgi:uncharacterized protein (UPF0335 family)